MLRTFIGFAGFFKRPTFTQTALRPFVIVFKQPYCSSRDLISCQNIRASEKIVTYIQNKSEHVQPTRSDLFCEVAPIYDLNLQVFSLLWKSFTPQNVGIICSSPWKGFNDIESENSVYVCIQSKRQQATRRKTQTFISTLDCFSLQIAILLSYKVTVILKVFPSHYRGWSEGNYTAYTTRWQLIDYRSQTSTRPVTPALHWILTFESQPYVCTNLRSNLPGYG